MVNATLAPKWSPLGLAQRLRNVIRRPGDVPLTLRIGFFIWRLPTDADRAALPALLDRLRHGGRPRAHDLTVATERIARLRQPWVRLTALRERDTCYVRALVLYRFLDAGDRSLVIHFGVEPPRDASDRLRGHAWVSVDEVILEMPDAVREGRVRELYRHPQSRPMRGGG